MKPRSKCADIYTESVNRNELSWFSVIGNVNFNSGRMRKNDDTANSRVNNFKSWNKSRSNLMRSNRPHYQMAKKFIDFMALVFNKNGLVFIKRRRSETDVVYLKLNEDQEKAVNDEGRFKQT